MKKENEEKIPLLILYFVVFSYFPSQTKQGRGKFWNFPFFPLPIRMFQTNPKIKDAHTHSTTPDGQTQNLPQYGT